MSHLGGKVGKCFFFAEKPNKMSLIGGGMGKMYLCQGESAQNVSYCREGEENVSLWLEDHTKRILLAGQCGKCIFLTERPRKMQLLAEEMWKMYLFEGEAHAKCLLVTGKGEKAPFVRLTRAKCILLPRAPGNVFF